MWLECGLHRWTQKLSHVTGINISCLWLADYLMALVRGCQVRLLAGDGSARAEPCGQQQRERTTAANPQDPSIWRYWMVTRRKGDWSGIQGKPLLSAVRGILADIIQPGPAVQQSPNWLSFLKLR